MIGMSMNFILCVCVCSNLIGVFTFCFGFFNFFHFQFLFRVLFLWLLVRFFFSDYLLCICGWLSYNSLFTPCWFQTPTSTCLCFLNVRINITQLYGCFVGFLFLVCLFFVFVLVGWLVWICLSLGGLKLFSCVAYTKNSLCRLD